MKIYRFFKKPTGNIAKNQKLALNEKYALYAITPEKKLAKKFRQTRNMDVFIENDTSLSKDESDEYFRRNRERILDLLEFETYIDKTGVPKFAKVLMTESEFNFVSEYTDTGSILGLVNNFIPVQIFKHEIQEMFDILYYQKAAAFVGASEYSDYSEDGCVDMDARFDMLGTFILLYGDCLSDGFYENIHLTRRPSGDDVITLSPTSEVWDLS